QVNGFNNLDECLEGAMVEGEIEALHLDQTISSGSEVSIPNSYQINFCCGKLSLLYANRYLHKNNEQIHNRREEVKRLKEQLIVLQQKLECYRNYGSGPTKYPLADMLQYVLEFACTKPTSVSPPVYSTSIHVFTVFLLISCFSSVGLLSKCQEPGDTGPSDSPTCQQQPPSGQRTPIYKPFTQCRALMDTPPHPAPHSVTEEELRFVKTCLQRWRTEVEINMNELKASIDRVSQALEGMYSDNRLCQVPYRLHAVLVHEGQASAGHYWAYIYDHANQRWMKYNDVIVSESSWEELVRDSYGGMTNASAYCLMYIDDRLPHLIAEDTDDETGQVMQAMDSLPPILRHYVCEDNRWFQQELKEWEDQFCQQPQEEPASPTAAVTSTPSKDDPAEPVPQPGAAQEPTGEQEHVAEFLAFQEEYSRLFELSQEETTPQQDPRLHHALVYFFQNQAPSRVIERTLLEGFTDRNLSFDDRSISIMREARAKLRLIKPEDMDMEEYMQWHDDYSLFRTVFVYLLTGLEQYQHGKVREALNYLNHAYKDNAMLLRRGEKRGMEQTLIAFYRRRCLKEMNDNAATLFRSGEVSDVEEGMIIMNEAVIPCMHLMSRPDMVSQEDLDTMEAVRSHWCSYLGVDLDDSLQEKLGEFLPRVLDCSTEMVVLKDPPTVRSKVPHDLCSRLAAIMESITNTSVVTVK
uniref:ubiquitinyl hydrolase 1 n=1 Tax=Hucho hucho TaxID=62062 RepID=A0A4W5LXZ2_9TELE